MNKMDMRVINNLKALSLDMINEAGSGQTDISLSFVPIIYALYKDHLKFDTKDFNWVNKDRFILTIKNVEPLLYANSFMFSNNLNLEDLKQYKSITQKYLEFQNIHNLDIATAVGMAISKKHLEATLNTNNHMPIIDYNIYVLCSDNDLINGISYEACCLAGKLKLNNLIVLYNSNNTIDNIGEDVLKRFENQNWHTILVEDGSNSSEISSAISEAKTIKDKPIIIKIKTTIENNNKTLNKEEIYKFKLDLNMNTSPFYIDKEALIYYENNIYSRNTTSVFNHKLIEKEFINTSNENTRCIYNYLKTNEFSINLNLIKNRIYIDKEDSTIVINSKILNEINKYLPLLIGGTASSKLYLENETIFSDENYGGKNILFEAHELVIGAITNGIALTPLIPFSSTFLSSSDYMNPSIRISALMNLFNIFIFTEENSEIFKSTEQIGTFRSISNLNTYRPADYNELIGTWNNILNDKKPAVIILSNNIGGVIENIDINNIKYGGYILKKEEKAQTINIVATGSDLHLAINLQKKLNKIKIYARIISIPCVNKFLEQKEEYKNSVVTPYMKTFVIESSNDSIWNKFVYNDKYIFRVNELDINSIYDKIIKLVK